MDQMVIAKTDNNRAVTIKAVGKEDALYPGPSGCASEARRNSRRIDAMVAEMLWTSHRSIRRLRSDAEWEIDAAAGALRVSRAVFLVENGLVTRIASRTSYIDMRA